MKPPSIRTRSMLLPAVLTAVLVFCSGCAAVSNPDPRDPLESFNRGVFSFNDALDQAIVKPAATLYRDATPQAVRGMVSNFLGNLEDIWSLVNSLLQGKGGAAAATFMRINVNTVMGLGGLLDVASELRIPRHDEDFGQTLGYWGFPSGPYLMVPFLGPTTFRDFAAWPVDAQGDALAHLRDVPARNTFKVLDVLDSRADLLAVEATLNQAALDRYSFIRDAFLQRRRNAVYDGDPPDENTERNTRPKAP